MKKHTPGLLGVFIACLFVHAPQVLAEPLEADVFAGFAAQRDMRLGEVFAESKQEVVFSWLVSRAKNTCSPRLEERPRHALFLGSDRIEERLPTVGFTVLALGKRLHEPIVGGDPGLLRSPLQRAYGGAAAIEKLDRVATLPAVAKQFNELVLTADRLCPGLRMVNVSLGFYDVLRGGGSNTHLQPVEILRLDFFKGQEDGKWILTDAVPGHIRSGQTLENFNGVPLSRAAALWLGNRTQERDYHWLADAETDHVFGDFVLRPPKGLPGIVYRDKDQWHKYSLSGDKVSAYQMEFAYAIFSGYFELSYTSADLDAGLGLIFGQYGKACRPNRIDTQWLEITSTSVERQRIGGVWHETRGAPVVTGHYPVRYGDLYEWSKSAPNGGSSPMRDPMPGVSLGSGAGSVSGVMGVIATLAEITRNSRERGDKFKAFFTSEGCESATVQQLLENLARKIRRQRSLQADAQAAHPRASNR